MRALRLGQISLISLLVLLSTGASNTSARCSALGHKMMCVCGCNQVLMECNHVGCQDSRQMLDKLQTDVSHGDTDTAILKAFQVEYGPTVLAAPMFTRFNDLAWIAPPLVLVLGFVAIVAVVRKWRVHMMATPETPVSSGLIEIRDQIRKETEL